MHESSGRLGFIKPLCWHRTIIHCTILLSIVNILGSLVLRIFIGMVVRGMDRKRDIIIQRKNVSRQMQSHWLDFVGVFQVHHMSRLEPFKLNSPNMLGHVIHRRDRAALIIFPLTTCCFADK